MKPELRKRVRIEEMLLEWSPDMKTAKLRIDYLFDISGPNWDLSIELWKAVVPPELPGRSKLETTLEILDKAAQAKATIGKYSHVGRPFGKNDKHVKDLVRNHKPYFLKRLAEFKAASKSK